MTITTPTKAGSTQLDELTRINIDDLLKAFGLEKVVHGRRLLNALSWWPARQFAHKIMRYDQIVGEAGLQTAGAWALTAFDAQLKIDGQENIPTKGPVLLLANHPGMTDTVALFASIPRPDLRVLAAVRPFLKALPQTTTKLIYINEEANNNLAAVRTAANYLRSGGAVLTFPAGQIEPDPARLPGAVASLQQWSASIALFARLAPATQIVPVLVGGVLSAKAQRTPLRLLRRTKKDQEWLASTMQIIVPTYRPTQVHVIFGEPITPNKCLPSHELMGIVAAAMQTLIEQHYPESKQRG